ncbi:MAG: MBL fold metallo-hydrolase [Bacteroidetes bacterium]|nr:MBL fold metallo-hydrolase [Bacteroidota bacterium]
MKTNHPVNFKIFTLSVFLINMTFVLSCQNRQDTISNEDNAIDALISVSNIRNNAILITFGSDAVTAINTNEGIVVIDAGISTKLTSKYRKIIEKEFQSNNFKYLINTHYHPDHYGGNNVFEEAEIVGYISGINEIMKQWKDTTKVINSISKVVKEYELQLQASELGTVEWIESFTQKMRYTNALKDAQNNSKILQPTLTFEDSLHIDIGEIKFEMIYFGKCHSNSDILIFIPELKILFTGDLVFKYGRPSIINSQLEDKDKWIRAVKWIEIRIPNIETIISGHGEILTTEDIKSFNKTILEKCLN